MMQLVALPFAYILRFCYWLVDKYAIALIFFTFLMTLIFAFVSIMQRRAMCDQAKIRPYVSALQKRYAGRTDINARNEFSGELMKLYKEHNVKASAGCLPMLIQLLLVIILFTIVQNPLTYLCDVKSNELEAVNANIYDMIDTNTITVDDNIKQIYKNAKEKADPKANFTPTEFQTYTVIKENPGKFADFLGKYELPDFKLFGYDLTKNPSFTQVTILIPILATAIPLGTTFLMQKLRRKDEAEAEAASNPSAASTMKTMMLITPVMTFVATISFQAILGLYWIYRSVFTAVLQVVVNKLIPVPVYSDEEAAAIEAEFNKDFVFKAPVAEKRRSLHYIDAEEDDEEYEDEDGDTENEDDQTDDVVENASEPVSYVPDPMPKRRMYDKDGNKIRSLHFIDEDDEETIAPQIDEKTDDSTEEPLNSNEE